MDWIQNLCPANGGVFSQCKEEEMFCWWKAPHARKCLLKLEEGTIICETEILDPVQIVWVFTLTSDYS